MRRRLTILAAVIAVMMAVLTAGSADAAPQIRAVGGASGFRWMPHFVHVAAGTKVVWKSVKGVHTVTAYRGRWKKNTTITRGATTSFRFRSAGVYRFRCRFHSVLVNGVCKGMCGKVVVG
jgi:plastocyanin